MADMTQIRSAYAFFQGKRPAAAGQAAPVNVPIAPKAAVAPAPAQPTMGGDQLSTDTAKVIAELERRIGQLEKALQDAKKQVQVQVPVQPTPPIAPVPNQPVDPSVAKIQQQIYAADQQAGQQIGQLSDDLSNGINDVSKEITRVTTQIGQVNVALQQNIPAITTQVNQTVNAFKGLIDTFKGIKF